jgi:hypothetical protein
MQDLLWQLRDIDSFTVYVSAAFAVVLFWFLREIAGAPLLALLSVPFLIAGGTLAPLVFRHQMITLAYDKDTNVAAMSAAGVLTVLIVLVAAKWLWTVLKERRVRRTKLVAAPASSRHRNF